MAPDSNSASGWPPGPSGSRMAGILLLGVQRQKLGRELVVRLKADLVRLVGQLHLFERDRHLHAVGRGQGIQLQPIRMARGPLGGDGMSPTMTSLLACESVFHPPPPMSHTGILDP